MKSTTWPIVAVALLVAGFLLSIRADAHCDTMDGPVAKAGLQALDSGNLDPALRWVSANQADELRHVFQTVQALRDMGEDVREVADKHFLETLVRLHRASEGAPYTGLKPAGTPIAPVVELAEDALAAESGEELVAFLTNKIKSGLESRLHHTLESAKHADDSVEHGREWVKAYVTFVHYVEAIDIAAAGAAEHGHDGQNPGDADMESHHDDH